MKSKWIQELLLVWDTSLILFLRLVFNQLFCIKWSCHVVDSKTGSLVIFLPQRRLQVQGCTLGDSPAGQDLQGTYGETGIEKFGVPYCCGRNSGLTSGRARSCMFASGCFTQGWPLMASKTSWIGNFSGWSCQIFGKLGVGPAEGAGAVASWKRPVCVPKSQWRGLLYCGFDFVPSLSRLEDGLAELFITFSNWMYSWARYRTSLQQGTLYLTRCLYSGWVIHSPWGRKHLHCNCIL